MSFFKTYIPELDKLDLNTQKLDKSLRDKVIRQWKACLDDPMLTKLYPSLIQELKLFRTNQSQPEKLYYFLKLFCSSDYKAIYDDKFHYALLKNTEFLQFEIEQLLIQPNTQIIQKTSPHLQGDLREMVGFLISLYFAHPSYNCEAYDELKCVGGNLTFKFLSAYSYQDTSNLLISLLPSASHAIEKYIQLINEIICSKQDDAGRNFLLYILLSEMIGFHTERNDFFYKNSKKALILLSPVIELWNDKQIDYFITEGILNVYGIYPNLQNKIAKIKCHINQLNEGNYSAQIVKKRVKEYNQEILTIENNPAAFVKASFSNASKILMVKNNTIKFLEGLCKLIPNSCAKTNLEKLVAQTLTLKNTPKIFPINKTAKIKFNDLNFKLLVVEELMYNKELLTPKFDLDKFKAEYHQREIDKEQEGYNVIPEVLAYFKGLDIPAELLEQVTSLTQDCGVDGGAEIYTHLWPFWDPGCGDEVLKLSNKASKDLPLLPNLKQVIGLEHSEPSKKLINSFQERHILLIEQDV